MGKGSNYIENFEYTLENKLGKIHVNKTQYFDNVPLDVWNFQIGGFAPIKKYLNEHKDREIELLEVEKMTTVIHSIAFTIEQMKKIDNQTKKWI